MNPAPSRAPVVSPGVAAPAGVAPFPDAALSPGAAPSPAGAPRPSRAATALLVGLSVLAGAAGALQGELNGVLGRDLGSPFDAAVVNNLTGSLALALAVAGGGSLRTGLRQLRRTRPPWWAFAGGVMGAAFVAGSAYAVPLLGVSVFAIAQVSGVSAGAIVIDGTSMGPAGRLPFSPARLAGAGLALVAVAVSELGRHAGGFPIAVLLLAILISAATAVQVTLNARVAAAAGSPGAATVVNFAVGTPAVLLAAAAAGSLPRAVPGHWWLYAGGLCGVFIVVANVLAVRVIGVLRTSLAMTAGQVSCALVIDALVPGRPPGPWLFAGSALTILAVGLAGARRTSPVPAAGWQTRST